jgi:hypothetical protein
MQELRHLQATGKHRCQRTLSSLQRLLRKRMWMMRTQETMTMMMRSSHQLSTSYLGHPPQLPLASQLPLLHALCSICLGGWALRLS